MHVFNFLKEADIVITNPPFSLFKEYVAQLVEYNKKFIIIGNKNAVTYKEIFPLIKDNKIWIGNRNMNSDFWLYVPEGAKYEKLDEDGKKVKHIMGCWYTNLDLQKRHDGLWHIGDEFDQSKAHNIMKALKKNILNMIIIMLSKYQKFKIFLLIMQEQWAFRLLLLINLVQMNFRY